MSEQEKYEKDLRAWNARHLDGSYTLNDPPPLPPPIVEATDDQYLLHISPKLTYRIERADIASESALLWWIKHLSHKLWCSRRLIRETIDTVSRTNGWRLGKTSTPDGVEG